MEPYRKVNLADAIWCVNELIRRGPRGACRLSADVNADGYFDLSDPVYLVLWQFLGWPMKPAPHPACGVAVGSPALACPDGAIRYCD